MEVAWCVLLTLLLPRGQLIGYNLGTLVFVGMSCGDCIGVICGFNCFVDLAIFVRARELRAKQGCVKSGQ